ncbi:Dihydrodipicolinate reductase-like protein CRR1, chloroplastic [Linum perenne]
MDHESLSCDSPTIIKPKKQTISSDNRSKRTAPYHNPEQEPTAHAMEALKSSRFQFKFHRISTNVKATRRSTVVCSVQPTQSNIKVIINGAAKEIGRAAVLAVTKARGMEVAGAVDKHFVGEDIGVATAFGMRSVVYVPRIKENTVIMGLQGCLVAPTLSIGSILLQQAAISASFHYNNVEIVESAAEATDLPSADAVQIAKNLSNLGQICLLCQA